MRLRSCLAAFAGVLAASALLAGPAFAGSLTVTPTVVGAGKIEDPGHYTCAASPPSNTTVTPCVASNGYVPSCDSICLLRIVLSLNAQPEPGWRFVGWSGTTPGCGTDPRCNFSVTPISVIPDAVFTPVATFHEIVDATVTDKPAALISGKSATLKYSSFAGTSVQCKLDGAAKPCTFNPATHAGAVTFDNLPDGPHTFQVTALSPNGNPSEPAATASWVVDTVAPDTTLDPTVGPGEGALQTVTAETFKPVSSEPAGATFECSLDDAPFTPCASPVTLTGLAPGPHSLQSRATDRAGNVDATAARRTWTIAVPDADGDGFNAKIDCNDAYPAIHPGANDVAGNGVDENCDGADASPATGPLVVQSASRTPEQVVVTLAFFAAAKKTSTTFTTLQVKNVPFGATVTVTCKGKGCPAGLKGKGFVKKNAFGTVSLAKFIKKPLRAGDRITVLVTKPDAINAVKVLAVRAAKKPLIRTMCQPPGAKSPVAC